MRFSNSGALRVLASLAAWRTSVAEPIASHQISEVPPISESATFKLLGGFYVIVGLKITTNHRLDEFIATSNDS